MSQKLEQKFSKLAIAAFICSIVGTIELYVIIGVTAGIEDPLLLSFAGLVGKLIYHLIFMWWGFNPFLIVLFVLSIIFGITATVKIRNNPGLKGKTLALTGSIVGSFMLLIYIYVLFGFQVLRI